MSVYLTDSRITESSWLVLSVKYPGLAYTGNDENGLIFTIDLATGKVVGTTRLSGVTLIDPESADLAPNGALWLCDGGNNDGDRSIYSLYVFAEPGRGDHTIRPERYRFRCSEPSVNIEAFFIRPDTGNRYVIGKNNGRLYRNDKGTLEQDTVGMFRLVGRGLASEISEAKFTPDSRFVLARQKGRLDSITVLDGVSFKTLGSFPAPKVGQPESLDTDGQFVWYGSEGKNSPLFGVPLPPAYRSETTGLVELSKFKRTRPTGEEGHPDEEYPLSDTTGPVDFEAPVDGVTTSGSSYARDELREMVPKAWSVSDGKHHQIFGRGAVLETPGRKVSDYTPGVVFGQIHGPIDDIVILLVDVAGRVVVEKSLGKGNGSEKTVLFAGYRWGDPLDWMIDAHRGGIDVTVNGHHVLLNAVAEDAYSKAGVYLRGNKSNATGRGRARIHQLGTRHAA